MNLPRQIHAVLAFFIYIAVIRASQTPNDMIRALHNLSRKALAIQPTADSIDQIKFESFTESFPRQEVINRYEKIVTSGVDYVYTFYGSTVITKKEEEEAVAHAYRNFVEANLETFKTIYYKAHLFEGHGYVGKPLTKVFMKLAGVYDSYSFAMETVTPHQNFTIQGWHSSLMIGLKTDYDRWKNLGTGFERSQFFPPAPQLWVQTRGDKSQHSI
ncbi:MAG: hypothetical protein Q9217_005843 [Psora testacea]